MQFLQVQPFHTSSTFSHEIGDRIRSGDDKGMDRLRILVSATCLRRNKECLGLLPRTNKIQPIVLDGREKQLYEICKKSTVEFIELAFDADEKPNNFATVIQLVLRLRQICDHGRQMLSKKTWKNIEDYISSQGSTTGLLSPVDTTLCGMCGRNTGSLNSLLPCMHLACDSCSKEREVTISEGESGCLTCADVDLQKLVDEPDESMDQTMCAYQPSSKVDALLRNIRKDAEDSGGSPTKRLDNPTL